MLMAAGLEVPRHVMVHGFLLTGGDKMPKSRGNVIDPFQVIEDFGTDALRFYLAREVPFGQDGEVSLEGFTTRYETELANDYGNLASRTVAMINRYRDGHIDVIGHDETIVAELDGLADAVCAHLDRFEITPALEEIWKRIRRLNRYVEEQQPWQLAKDPERAEDLDRVLATLHESVRIVTVLLHPYLPAATTKLLAALGRTETGIDSARCVAAPVDVTPLEPLFPKRQAVQR
jgi:methionyl-tRNA synthetase